MNDIYIEVKCDKTRKKFYSGNSHDFNRVYASVNDSDKYKFYCHVVIMHIICITGY